MSLFFTDNFSKFKKHKRYSLLFILPLLSISVSIINPSFAAVNSAKEPVISLTAKNEPLKLVLEKISKATGYKIEVSEGWENKPVTVDIQTMTLDDSLNKIIRALGSPNNAKINYDNKKVIRINFFDTSKAFQFDSEKKNFNQHQIKQSEAVINIENLPPMGDNKIPKDTATKIDPLDIEVIPPEKLGEKGITVRELKSMGGNKKEINPLDIEVIPPKKLGEKGVTVRELKEINTKQTLVKPSEIMIIPPENFDKRAEKKNN